MIRARAGAVEELDALAFLVRRANDEALEFLGAEQPGTGTRHENSPGPDQPQGQAVEIFILPGAVLFVVAREDELRRVGYNEIPSLAVLLQLPRIAEGVAMHPHHAGLV